MASFFKSLGKMFGLTSGEKVPGKAEHQMPLQNLMDYAPGYKGLFERTQKRSLGEGLGIDPNLLDRSTSALAAQRRAGLQEQTIPQISQQASARGMGRSTIPTAQIGQASQAVERDIEQRLADLTLANEQEKIRQRELADQGLLGMSTADAQQQNAWRQAMSADFDRIQGARQAQDQAQQAGLTKLISTGLGALSGGVGAMAGGGGILGGILSGGVGGFSPSQVLGTDTSLIDLILGKRGASTVPGTANTNVGTYARTYGNQGSLSSKYNIG